MSALQPAAPRLVLHEVESKQSFEAESLGRAVPVEPVFERLAAVVVEPAIRREAARHTT